MGVFNNDILMEVLVRVCYLVGIELIIFIRKNCCFGEIKGVRKFSEKELFIEIRLFIFKKLRLIKFFLYIDFFFI